MNKSLTNTLSSLYVAEKKGKKLMMFDSLNCNFDLLNFLWRNGFIYGYERSSGRKATVFLKHTHSRGFFSNIIFLKKQKVSLQELKNLLFLHKNYYYLIWTSEGIISGNNCVLKNMGGYLIARL
jgi:ribosomal protein S8